METRKVGFAPALPFRINVLLVKPRIRAPADRAEASATGQLIEGRGVR